MSDMNYVRTRRRKSYARKYRDLLAECPIDKHKIIRILGEIVLESSSLTRYGRIGMIDVHFWDCSRLSITLREDGTLRRQFLDERDWHKGWEYKLQ